MAPSSLKKMCGFRRMKEGNYASLERTLWDTSVDSDLGLTLLPGSQSQRKDERRLGTAAESSPKVAGTEYIEQSKQLMCLGAEIRPKNSTQEIAILQEAKNLSSFPIPGPESVRFSCWTADINRGQQCSENLTVKNDSGAVQCNADSAEAAPYNEQQLGIGELGNARSSQHENYSSRVMKRKKLGSRTSNEFQDSRVSKRKETAFETHHNTFHVHYDQALSENDAIQSGKRNESIATIGLSLSGTRAASKFSKSELHLQLTRSLDDTPSHDDQSTTGCLAPATPAMYQNIKHGKLKSHYQPPNLWKCSPQDLKHSRLPPEKVRAQVLKSGKRVNRSWTSHFPAKARRFPHYANLPASSLLAAPLSPNEIISLKSINFNAYTNFSSTPPSKSSLNYPGLSKAFNDPLDLRTFEKTLNTAHTGNQRQAARIRSASMPSFWSTPALTNMASSNNVGPVPMPTPPREEPSFSPHPRETLAESYTTQEMSDPSITRNSTSVAEGSPSHRLRLEFKPNYSREEVKFLMNHFVKQVQSLKVENIDLQSSHIALKNGIEGLKSEKARMIKQIQRYECTVTRKDQQIAVLEQRGRSLQKQYKQVWENHQRLVADLRKENGTGNPSAIAQRIRRNHAHSTIGAASQGHKPNLNASPVSYADRVQPSIPRLGLEQIALGLGGHMQPLSVPGFSEADIMDASSRSEHQQGHADANHNLTNPPQRVPLPVYLEANLDNTSNLASVTARFPAAKHNSVEPPHDPSTRSMQSNLQFDATAGTVTTDLQNDKRLIGHVPPERVTIDLTDESQPPSSAASRDPSINLTTQSSVQDGRLPFNLLPSQYSPAQYEAGNCVPSQCSSDISKQNQTSQGQLSPKRDSQRTDGEAMQIQKEAFARMAEKPLSWLQGENPFRKEAKTEQYNRLPNARRFSQGNAEESVIFAGSPEVGSVAPLPETATPRQSKMKAPKKAKVVLTAEAKKERARLYRKTAADKKKREKEAAKQSLQCESMATNAMRAQKQDRRANKGQKRQEHARKPSGEVGPQEPQKTLDGQLYHDDTGVQQAVHQGSMDQAPSSDHDSLFGDDEDNQMENEDFETSLEADCAMHEDDAAGEDCVDSAFVAELEAQLLADADAATWTGFEQIGTLGGDDGHLDCLFESEESEEE